MIVSGEKSHTTEPHRARVGVYKDACECNSTFNVLINDTVPPSQNGTILGESSVFGGRSWFFKFIITVFE